MLSSQGLLRLLMADPCEDFARGVYPTRDFRTRILREIAGAQNDLRAHSREAIALAAAGHCGESYYPNVAPECGVSRIAMYLSGQIGVGMVAEQRWLQALSDVVKSDRL